MIKSILKILKLILRKLYIFLNSIDEKLETNKKNSISRILIKRKAASYDMSKDKNEHYYCQQYTEFIYNELKINDISRNINLLDLGCGQGRIIQSLIKNNDLNFNKIIGIDFSTKVINQAQNNLKDKPINLELLSSDIFEYLQLCEDYSQDVILILEVLYMVEDFEKVLKLVHKKIKKNGLIFISLRSDYYYGLTLLRNGLFESIKYLSTINKGKILGGDVMFNWSNSNQIKSQFPRDYGLNIRNIFGVGVFSGIKGDPHDFISMPSSLSTNEKDTIFTLEKKYGFIYPDNGRYILFSASKDQDLN